MSDYYIQNRTFFLSGSKIYSSEGSGSSVDKTNGIEMTTNWVLSQSIDISSMDVLNIVKQVSGSYYYIRDKMEF